MISIFIHGSKNSESLNEISQVYPGLVFFNELNDILPKLNSYNDIQNCIICAEEKIIVNQLAQYSELWIINTMVLKIILQDLNQIFKKELLFNLLRDVILSFAEFPKDDRMMILGTKAILMGARFTNCINALTHMIPYRMCGSTIIMIRELHKDVKIYDKSFIEYYWNNCVTIFCSYKDLHNDFIKNNFKARLFMNCCIVLIGFDQPKLLSMMTIITDNGGSVLNMNSVDHASHIIIPFSYLSNLDVYYDELNLIPSILHKNIVNERWFELSLSTGYLSSIENYQLINVTKGHLQDNYSNNVDSPDTYLKDNINKLDFHSHDPCIGYNSNKVSETYILDHNIQRLEKVKEFVNYFYDKHEFFHNLISFLLTLRTENQNLQIIIEGFAEISQFYLVMCERFDSTIQDIDDDTFIGMIASSTFSCITECHKRFIQNFFKIDNQLKKATKENLAVKEKLEAYLHTINYSIEGLLNRPMLLLPRIKLIIDEIIKNSPYLHPDMTYLQDMIDKTDAVIQYHSSLLTMDTENTKQAIISKCTDKAICSGGSQFVSVVDCVLMELDGITIPMSMFIFTDKIMLSKFCNQTLVNKRIHRLSTFLKSNHDENINLTDSIYGSLSRCSSSQSLFMSPNTSHQPKTNFTRKDSTKSNKSNIEKSQFYLREAVKFSKLFSGLSKLKLWGNNIPVIYNSSIIYQSSDVRMIISHMGGNTVESQLMFSLKFDATDTEHGKQLKFLLVPRIVKQFSDYGKISTVFEDDIAWDASNIGNVSWRQFIVEEKYKFCELVAKLYDISVIDDATSISLNRGFLGSQLSLCSSDSFNFLTPRSNMKEAKHTVKDLFKKGVKSLRRSFCPNSSIKSLRERFMPSSDSILETDSDLSSPMDCSRRSSVVHGDLRLTQDSAGFYTPQTKRLAKRKSRDVPSTENKTKRL